MDGIAEQYIESHDRLKALLKKLRLEKKRIVLTQGVYDLIHEGHAKYLQLAKSYGDVLIVGVDSDALTKKRKGNNRPIVPEAERIAMLLHLKYVDYVILRHVNEGMSDLIRIVKPDTLISSSSTGDIKTDWRERFGDVCGEVVVLPPQSTTSTSARIRQLTIDGASSLANEIQKLTEEYISKIRGV